MDRTPGIAVYSGKCRDNISRWAVRRAGINWTPDREFDLGLVGPDERIVRELEAGKVVGATVVKDANL